MYVGTQGSRRSFLKIPNFENRQDVWVVFLRKTKIYAKTEHIYNLAKKPKKCWPKIPPQTFSKAVDNGVEKDLACMHQNKGAGDLS